MEWQGVRRYGADAIIDALSITFLETAIPMNARRAARNVAKLAFIGSGVSGNVLVGSLK